MFVDNKFKYFKNKFKSMNFRMDINEYKNHFGIIFFALSILILISMIFSPLNKFIFYIDEYFTLFVIKFSIIDVIKINIHDVHPPLYYFIIKAIAKILSLGNISYNPLFLLRIISFTPYGLILLFSATIVRKDYGWLTAGIFTLAIGCFSEFYKFFLVGRMYSIALLFLLISFYFYRNVLKDSDRKSWILFTIFSVLCAYTHYFAAISSVVLYLLLLAYILYNNSSFKTEFKKWILSVALGILLYLPWVFPLLGQLTKVHNKYWIQDLTLNSFIKFLTCFAVYTNNIFIQIIVILSLIFFTAIILKEFNNLRDNENYFILSGIIVFIGTLLIGSILSLTFKPILVERYLIPASAVFWFAISIMVGKLKNRRILTVALILILLLSAFALNETVKSNEVMLKSGQNMKKILSDVNDDADIVISNSYIGVLEFADFLKDTQIYTSEMHNRYNISDNEIDERYDVIELNESEIKQLIYDNPDKNIYYIDAWGNDIDGLNKTKFGKIPYDVIIYKINEIQL